MLHSDDFRSYERTFSLLTQVVGRSGRGGLEGRAIIQTYEPENPIISLAAAQNYNEFYDSEIRLRQSMLYPPFADLCVVVFAGERRDNTQEVARQFFEAFQKLSGGEYHDLPLRVLRPSPALIPRMGGKYRYRMIIKFKSGRRFREMLSRLLLDFSKQRERGGVSVYADIDPDSIL